MIIVLQYSKILKSRDEWRNKATKRAEENREYKKTKNRHLKTISDLKAENLSMKQSIEDKKKL